MQVKGQVKYQSHIYCHSPWLRAEGPSISIYYFILFISSFTPSSLSLYWLLLHFESRVLIVFKDGLLILWDLQSSSVVLSASKGTQFSSQNESKTVTSACWACTHGSKVAIGYSSGDIYLWSIPALSNENSSSEKGKSDASSAQNVPLLKLNLGFKLDKVPIVSLRWVPGDSKTNRLSIC